MQLKDFIKLNKNYGEMNHGKDLTDEFLINIYKSIASEQIFTSSIVVPLFSAESQATNDQLRNEQWVNVIRQSHIPEKQQFIAHSPEFFEHCAHCSAGMYDRDIFSIVWSSSLAAAGALLKATTDHRLMEFTLDVFVTLARISAYFNLSVFFLFLSQAERSRLARLLPHEVLQHHVGVRQPAGRQRPHRVPRAAGREPVVAGLARHALRHCSEAGRIAGPELGEDDGSALPPVLPGLVSDRAVQRAPA